MVALISSPLAYGPLQPIPSHPHLDLIHDITGAEKLSKKPTAFNKMIATYVYSATLFVQHNYVSGVALSYHKRSIVHLIFQISFSLNTKCADKTGFRRPGHI